MDWVWQQLAAVVAVVVGAVSSYVTLRAGEKARWQRELPLRWNVHTLDAYDDYAKAVKAVMEVALRITKSRGYAYPGQMMTPEDGLVRMDSLESERAARWERVLLLGGPESVAAARRWHQTVWALERIARGTELPSHEAFANLIAENSITREHFYAAARTELGILGALPPANHVWIYGQEHGQRAPDAE